MMARCFILAGTRITLACMYIIAQPVSPCHPQYYPLQMRGKRGAEGPAVPLIGFL